MDVLVPRNGREDKGEDKEHMKAIKLTEIDN